MELLVHYVLLDVTRMIHTDPLSPLIRAARSDPLGHTQIHADSRSLLQIPSGHLSLCDSYSLSLLLLHLSVGLTQSHGDETNHIPIHSILFGLAQSNAVLRRFTSIHSVSLRFT